MKRRKSPTLVRSEPTWGRDRIYPCPFCTFTSEGHATLGVALHVNREHPERKHEWKETGRAWSVVASVPVGE